MKNAANDAATLAESASKAAGAGDVVNNLKPQNLLDELTQSGAKYTPDDVITVAKTYDGKLIWLEKGNNFAGLEHVMKHSDEFVQKGISVEQIPEFLTEAASKDKIVGMQRTRPIYEITFNGQTYKVAIEIGSNGFIVGANMR